MTSRPGVVAGRFRRPGLMARARAAELAEDGVPPVLGGQVLMIAAGVPVASPPRSCRETSGGGAPWER